MQWAAAPQGLDLVIRPGGPGKMQVGYSSHAGALADGGVAKPLPKRPPSDLMPFDTSRDSTVARGKAKLFLVSSGRNGVSPTAMSDVTIYHNPACGTSRNTLALLREKGIEPKVVEYLKTGWTKETASRPAQAPGPSARDILRVRGTDAR